MVENPASEEANQHTPKTDFSQLTIGEGGPHLVEGNEGGRTVPEEDQRTHLPIDPDFIAYGRSRRRLHPLLQLYELFRG